jgi:hypothetical protein
MLKNSYEVVKYLNVYFKTENDLEAIVKYQLEV